MQGFSEDSENSISRVIFCETHNKLYQFISLALVNALDVIRRCAYAIIYSKNHITKNIKKVWIYYFTYMSC